jgi:hypothetical protein
MTAAARCGNTLHNQDLVRGGYVEEAGEVILQTVHDVCGNPAAMAVLCQPSAQVSIRLRKRGQAGFASLLYSQSGIVIILQCLSGGSKNI